jgi:hypothetical protein
MGTSRRALSVTQPSKVELPLPLMTPCIVFPANLEVLEVWLNPSATQHNGCHHDQITH